MQFPPLIRSAPSLLMPAFQTSARTHDKEMIPIMAVIALIPLALVFQKRRRQHHKDPGSIEPETRPLGPVLLAGALPAGQLIPITGPDAKLLHEPTFLILIGIKPNER